MSEFPSQRPEINSLGRTELLHILYSHVIRHEAPLSTIRIYNSIKRFASEPFPTGFNETQFRFLVTAGLFNLGEDLNQRDMAFLPAVLDYYTQDVRLSDLRRRLRGVTAERVRQLRDEGLHRLYDALPAKAPKVFPFNFEKERDFPEAAFKRTGRLRAGAAMARGRRARRILE